MTTGLPTSRLIQIAWSITNTGASYANINSMVIVGDSNVINVTERMRSYSSALAVATDFGTTAPEYLAATEFFAQKPTPAQLFIGRWARTATAGLLVGGALTTVEQALSNFTAVSSGGFKIKVDAGSLTPVTGINLSAATSLTNVASLITTALTGASVGATCTWSGSQFLFTSSTTGATSSVSLLQAPASGTDISTLLNGIAANGAYAVAGIAAESPLAAVQALDNLPTYWWALTWACATMPADSDYEAVAAYIETTAHLHGITTAESAAITSGNTSDVGSVLMAAGYQRTFGFFSANSPYAAAGAMGDLLTTNLLGVNTMPTLQWKTIAGATPDAITVSQANELDTKRYNYYSPFNNGAAIIVNGMCFGPAYIDEIFGLDWQANQIQTDIFNLMTSLPKVPQTDGGMTLIINTIEASLERGVRNGLIAGGTWNAAGFGTLVTGAQLPKGYYCFIPPLATQSQTTRSQRITPPIQIAIKLAGAVHDVDVVMTINR